MSYTVIYQASEQADVSAQARVKQHDQHTSSRRIGRFALRRSRVYVTLLARKKWTKPNVVRELDVKLN